jgi:hypothetical protein
MKRRTPDAKPPEEHINPVSQYPPGMQVDIMLENWKKDGINPSISRPCACSPG